MAYVPDAGHSTLIELFAADPAVMSNVLTTEEEGIAIAAGAWLGGQRGVLLMQSSGVGNCINMLSLPVLARIPLLMLVTMRGEWAEFNPWQMPMSRATQPALEAIGVQVMRAETPDDLIETVEAAAALAYGAEQQIAVLIGAAPYRQKEVVTPCSLRLFAPFNAAGRRRAPADRGDPLVVTGLGSPSYDVHAVGDRDDNFYLWGAMGGAALVGLGLAQAQPATGASWSSPATASS